MKRLAVLALIVSSTLASCTLQIQSSEVALTGISYTTNKVLESDYIDQDNNPLPKGTSVICDNTSTIINLTNNWTGGLKSVETTFVGKSGGSIPTNLFTYTPVNTSGVGTISYTLGNTTTPLSMSGGISALSINTQSIVIVGKAFVKGRTALNVRLIDRNGIANSSMTGNYIPVIDCK